MYEENHVFIKEEDNLSERIVVVEEILDGIKNLEGYVRQLKMWVF